MRLCWNDWFGGPLRDLKPADAKTIRDIGYRFEPPQETPNSGITT